MTNALVLCEYTKTEIKKMPKVVTDKETLKALEIEARTGEVSEKIIAELKVAKKTPNQWFELDCTNSSTHVRRVITNSLKETVKSKKTPNGNWNVRRLGTKTKDKKVVQKGKVFVKYSA